MPLHPAALLIIARKYYCILLCLLTFQLNINASPQIPDILLYKGDTLAVYKLLVEQYLQSIKAPDEGRLFGYSFRGIGGTSCWRGYRAVYKIENDSLFLVYMLGCYDWSGGKRIINDTDSRRQIQEIFGERYKNGKVFINWYSGELTIKGKRLLRWDGIFDHNWYSEKQLVIKKGKLQRIRTIKNYTDRRRGISRDLPDKTFFYYGKPVTDTLFAIIRTWNWVKWPDCGCDNDYIIIINPKGRIREIHLNSLIDPKENAEWELELQPFIKKMLHDFRKLRFDIVKWHGRPWSEQVYFKLFYSKDGLENWSNH